jgi:hypothetical protein
MAALETRVRDDAQVLLGAGPVVVFASRGLVDEAMYARVHDELVAALAEHPEGVGLLVVSSTGSELASLGMRRKIAESLAGLGDRLQVAAALEGGSWWVGGARKLVAKILAQMPTRVPIETFTDREQALAWLSETLHGPDGRPLDLDELGNAIDQALAGWPTPRRREADA